jgi:uncharacterized membrane protein YjjP (DUF1212 family)
MNTSQRRYIIKGSAAGISVGLLCAAVIVLYGPLRFPVFAAVVVGGGVSSIVSSFIRRRFLPEPPPWSDEERVQLPRLRPIWLPVGVAAIAVLYLVVRLPLLVAGVLVILSIVYFVYRELGARHEAEYRLGRQRS